MKPLAAPIITIPGSEEYVRWDEEEEHMRKLSATTISGATVRAARTAPRPARPIKRHNRKARPITGDKWFRYPGPAGCSPRLTHVINRDWKPS